ncbi:DUF5776 domain-containing protein [Apilactobacillus micheneri]|uniref:DUF5776 domain-containing protein n=1 Tax=Apilactobacillus micheneri TaxID=1899430 RepID=UPI0011285079|nr:DUF5776 domain-containing protein [Apilactobacillus micheneri]TPR38861.1 hypothetical protein DY119_04120 [Apilactobacillus micheneri]
MQYNKHNIEKVNEKKIMRKVKKQWVVLSVSAFAALGASAFLMFNPDEVNAHADITTTKSAQSINVNGSGAQSVGRTNSVNQSVKTATPNEQNQGLPNNTPQLNKKSGNQSTQDNTAVDKGAQTNAQDLEKSNGDDKSSIQNNQLSDSKVSAQTSQSANNNSTKAQNDWNNGQKDTNNSSNDYKNTYNNSANGFKDAMNNDNKNIVQSQNNNTPSNLNPSKTDSGYQNGVNQYNNYRNIMNSGASDAYNGKGDNSSLQTDATNKNYYESAYNGAQSARNDYNNVTQNEGTSNQDYTNYKQWLSDNNRDQTDTPANNKNNVAAYSNSLNDKLNSKGNVSVHTNANSSVQVAKPNDTAITNQQDQYNQQNGYDNNSNYALAYQYGINYFLANQGATDAKSGKWNGSNGANTMKSFYNPDAKSTNPYDQAYLGAKAAINKQINQTQSGTNTQVNNYSGSNSALYQSGYNDAAKQTQSGTVYIGNAVQMDNVLKNDMSNTNSLKLVNDIAFQNYSQWSLTNVHNINSNNLDIDGQNHILDQTDTSYTFLPNNPNTKLNIHNFQTLYGANYYGPFAFDNSGNDSNANTYSMTYSNINYVGSKLLSSYYSDVYINGNVNQDDVDTYTSPFNSMATQTSGSYGNGGNYQPGLQINNMVLGTNSNYFGNSAQQTGGTTLEINGNLTLGEGSNMTLMPTGAAEGQGSPDTDGNGNGSNYGINITNSEASINVNKNAILNIYPQTSYGTHVSDIYSKGNINVNGGTINAEAFGNNTNGKNVLIYSNGQVNILNGGSLNVKASNMSNSNGLINNNANMNVNSGGSLTVDGKNTSGIVNLISGNKVNVYDVGDKNVNLFRNINPNSSFSTAGINGYTVRAYTDPNNPDNTWYYNFDMNNSGQYTGTDQNGAKKTGNITAQSLYISAVPAARFIGPTYVTKDKNNNTVINGYAKVEQYSKDAGPVYIQYVGGNTNGQNIPQYSEMHTIGNPEISNGFSSIDTDKYNQQVNISGNEDLIPVSFTVPAGTPNYDTFGIRVRYGVSGVNEVTFNNKYTSNVEGRSQSNSGLVENDSVLSSGSVDNSNQGLKDSLDDLSNYTNDKNSTMYQKDADYTNSYDSAQDGYKLYNINPNLGLNDQNSINNILSNTSSGEYANINNILTNVSDPGSFMRGYARAKADNQGHIDGASSFNNNGYRNANSSQTVAYQNNYNTSFTFAMNGFQDALNGSKKLPNPSGNVNDSANIAYNAGYNEEQNAINGANLAAQNPSSDVSGQANSYQAGFNAYNQALNDYNAKHQASDVSSQPPLYQKMYNYQFNTISDDVNKGINDAQNNPNAGNQYSGSVVQKQAYAATIAGTNAQANNAPQPSDFDKQSPIYQNAYNNAYNQAKQAAASGSNLTPAQQAANANSAANVKQATSDAADNDPSKAANYQGNSNADMTYQGAQAGYSNGGTNKMDPNKASNPYYQNAFNEAQRKAQQAAQNGVSQFQNGASNTPNESTPAEQQADSYGYNQAQAGYNAQNNGTVDNSNNDPSYKAGVQIAIEADNGVSDAKNNPTQGSSYQGTPTQADAYNATVAGSNDGASGNKKPNLADKSRAYQDAYNNAYDHAKGIANRAAAGQLNENNLNNSLDRNSFAKGNDQAKEGYNAALANDPTVNDSKYSGNNNSDLAYQGARDGFTDGKQHLNNPKMTDPVYANAYNEAQSAAAKAADTGSQEFAQTPPNNTAAGVHDALSDAQSYGFDEARKGYNDKIAGIVDSTNKNPNYQQGTQYAVDSEQARKDAGENGPTPNHEDGSNVAQSQAYAGAIAGASDGAINKSSDLKGKSQIYVDSYNKAKKSASDLAYQGASGVPVSPSVLNDKLNNQAYTQGVNDYNNAYHLAANQDNPANDNNHNSNSNFDGAYNGSIAGFNAANRGDTSNPTGQNAVYNRAYNQAVNTAKAAIQQGIGDFANGDNQSSTSGQNNPVANAHNNAYNEAMKGYNANPADNQDTNPGYQAGVQMKNDMNSGINAANSATTQDPNYSGDSAQRQAYQATFAATNAAMHGQQAPNLTGQSRVYQDAYNQAYQQTNNAINNGDQSKLTPAQKQAMDDNNNKVNAAANAASNDDQSADSNYQGTDNASRTYQGARAGYANGGNNKMDPSQENNPYYKQAFDDAQKKAKAAANNGSNQFIDGKANTPSEATPAEQAADKAGYNQAQAGYEAATNGTDDPSNTDPSYRAGVQAAKDIAKGTNDAENNPNQGNNYQGTDAQKKAYQATTDATQAAMNGQSKPTDLSNQSRAYQDAYNNAYDKAKKVADEIANGNFNPSGMSPLEKSASKQANDSVNNAITDAQANDPADDQKYQGNDNASMAYQGTKAGFANNGNNDLPADNNNPYYKDAFNKAKQAAQDAASKGAQEYVDGATKSSTQGKTDAISVAHNNGYNQMQNGYTDQRRNNVDPDNSDPSYAKGIQLAKDESQGAIDAQNVTKPASDYSGSDAQKQAYQATFDGIKAGANSEPKPTDLNTKSRVYQDAYNAAYNQAQASANALANGSPNTNLSPAEKAVISDANNNVTTAKDKAAENNPADDSNYQGNTNSDMAYQGAKAGYANGGTGTMDPAKVNNPFYRNAFNDAQKQAQQAAQTGIKQFNAGKNNVPNEATPAQKAANKYGYDQAQAGYNDQNDGKAKTNNANPAYQAGFQMAKDVAQGIDDAKQSTNPDANEQGSDAQKQAYQGTIDAYKNNGKNIDLSNKSKAYQDAYNKVLDQAKSSYENGIDQFNNDQPNSEANDNKATSIAHNNGYQAAQSIYNQVLKDPNSVDSSNLDSAQKVGYEKAQQAINGLKDYASGKQPTNTDSNYMDGYNTAKQAAQAAMNDARNGKAAQSNIVPSGMNPQLYNDVYNATYSGYNNGYSGNSNKSNQGFAYNIAYQNAYNQGQYDVPVVSTTQQQNANKPNRNSNKEAKNYDNVDQNTNKGIIDAINGHKMKFDSTRPYKNGFNLGKEALKGMRAAEYGRKAKQHINSVNKSFYMFGYNGYKSGVRAAKRTLKANKRLSKHDLVGKSVAYVYAYKQGEKAEKRHQHNLGTKQGIAMAKKDRAIPTSLSMTHSAQYVESYVKAYKRTMKRNMPKYVYNVRTIFVHKQLKFNKGNRIVRYVKVPRYKAKLLRITGIAYYKNGIPRYRVVGGGMIADKRGTGIIAANDNIVNAYYRHNFKYFKVIKPKGTLTYKGMKFTKDNKSRKVYHGEIFKVDKVVKYHGLTRFYLGHGQYITSNKTIVKKVG